MSGRPLRLKILEFFLKQVIPIPDQENLTGDFEEMLGRISRSGGKAKALIWYILQIIKFIPSYFRNNVYWSLTMLNNYLKIALRHLKKFKAYSFINISGLALGMACCILILFFIQDELSYDRHHEKADRIYRVVDSFDIPGGIISDFALTSAPLGPTLKNEFHEVEDAARLFIRRRMVAYGDKKHYEDGLFYADASVFSIFSFPFVQGDPETALESPNSVVISEAVAAKYFAQDEAADKILQIDGQDFVVKGVMKNTSKNSHFVADIFVSFKALEQNPVLREAYFENWVRHEFYTYVLLREGTSAADLQAKLPGMIEKHAAEQVKSFLNGSISSHLQPLTDIHLHSHLQAEIQPNSDIKFVYVFSVIAFFILMIACVNFMNLATARSASRAKEVGLRKVVGANRSQLVKQFLGESLLFTLFALFLALILVAAARPFFNQMTGKELEMSFLGQTAILGGILAILFFVGLASGSYPAFFISRYQPGSVLKRALPRGARGSAMRKGLVILQFSISIILIISTAVVFSQLDFLKNRKLGFQKDHVVLVPIRSASVRENAESIKAELGQNTNILSATIANAVPGGNPAGDIIKVVTEEGRKTFTTRMIYTDHDYLKTMGIETVLGRDFSKDLGTDTNEAFIINEAAARELQLQDPLKTQIEYGSTETAVGKRGRIVGVARDYQFQSLRQEITPIVIHIWPSSTRIFAIRIGSSNIPETLRFIEDKWKEWDPANPYEYSFLDETFDRLYRSEERLGRIVGTFSGLAIFIAALGLFGLALYTIEQRTKEIGIRKVLGASAGSVFCLLSREFGLLVLVSNIVAWPTAYVLMHQWLQSFAYRIDLGLGVFVLAAVLAAMIAFVTVSIHALKAATANPTDSLRYE